MQRYDLNRAIGEDNLDEAKAELDTLVAQLSPGAAPGEAGETQRLSLDRLRGAGGARRSRAPRRRLVALFDGDVEYLINCQSTPKRRADIEKACEQVLETVEKK